MLLIFVYYHSSLRLCLGLGLTSIYANVLYQLISVTLLTIDAMYQTYTHIVTIEYYAKYKSEY